MKDSGKFRLLNLVIAATKNTKNKTVVAEAITKVLKDNKK